jgi:type IV pilus assembly protein PilN
MARINLLPWREELRDARRKRFLLALVGVLAGSVGAVLIADQIISGAIDRQVARNDYIGKQIAVVDERIKQISDLKSRRQQLASSRTCKAIAPSAGGFSTNWRAHCRTGCISPK